MYTEAIQNESTLLPQNEERGSSDFADRFESEIELASQLRRRLRSRILQNLLPGLKLFRRRWPVDGYRNDWTTDVTGDF